MRPENEAAPGLEALIQTYGDTFQVASSPAMRVRVFVASRVACVMAISRYATAAVAEIKVAVGTIEGSSPDRIGGQAISEPMPVGNGEQVRPVIGAASADSVA